MSKEKGTSKPEPYRGGKMMSILPVLSLLLWMWLWLVGAVGAGVVVAVAIAAHAVAVIVITILKPIVITPLKPKAPIG